MADRKGEAAWGVEGEAVVSYCEPLTTPKMGYRRFSRRVNKIEIKNSIHIPLMVEILKWHRIIKVLVGINILSSFSALFTLN